MGIEKLRQGASSHGDVTEGKVDSVGTGERVDAFAQGCDSMVDEAGGASPYGDVAVFHADSAGSVGAGERTEQEGGGESERDGDDGLGEALLVLILMEREAS